MNGIITAKIIQSFPFTKGTSAKTGKEWKKKEVEVKTIDQYPDTFKIVFFNDKIDLLKGLNTTDVYEFHVDIKGRKSDWQGKTYFNTDINCFKIESVQDSKVENRSVELTMADLEDDGDDIPF